MDFVWLRLLLAASVIVTHFNAILPGAQLAVPAVSGTVAVQAFFVISGWIVTASYLRSGNVAAFYIRRLARLLPLYWFVVVAQALAVTCLVGTTSTTLSSVLRYLAANLAFANFLQPSLLGFLENQPVQAINPSLWTLKIEIMFYLSVPLLAWCVVRFRWLAVLVLFALSTLYVYWFAPVSAELAKQLPGQMRFFVVGVACHLAAADKRVQALDRWPGLACLVAGLFLAHRFENVAAMAVMQPVFVLMLVLGAIRILPNAPGLPDMSFGVYLVHAPLIQIGNYLGLLEPTVGSFINVLAATLLLAWTASRTIEVPAIRLGGRLSAMVTQRAMLRRGPVALT